MADRPTSDALVIAGSATYPDGFRLERHQHDDTGQLTFCIGGVMRVASDAVAWLSPPTRAIWLPPGAPHEIVMRGEVATRFLYLDAGAGRAAAARAAGAGGDATLLLLS